MPTNTTPHDEAFALFCEQGRAALAFTEVIGDGRHTSPLAAMTAAWGAPVLPSAPRIHTGYMSKAERNFVAHEAYNIGARKPRPRLTADDKARAEAEKWNIAR